MALATVATGVMVSLRSTCMARRYSQGASRYVERAMKKRKKGSLRSGRSGRKVTSRKQAIAIGLSEAQQGKEGTPEKPALKPSGEFDGFRVNILAQGLEYLGDNCFRVEASSRVHGRR